MTLIRFFCGAFIILCSLFFVSTSFAATTISTDTITNQLFLDQAKEKVEVEQALSNTSNFDPKTVLVKYKDILDRKDSAGASALKNVDNPNNLEYGDIYKVVSAQREVAKALLDGSDLTTALQASPYHWEVPILAQDNQTGTSQAGTPQAGALNKNSSAAPSKVVAAFSIAKQNNTWEDVGFVVPLSLEQISFSSDVNEVTNLFKGASIKTADSIIHFRIYPMNIDFLYIVDGKKEYFVPLIHIGDELYGLKNKAVYNRQQIVAAIGPTLKKLTSGNSDNLPTPGGLGGYPSRSNNPSGSVNYNKFSLLPLLGVLLSIKLV